MRWRSFLIIALFLNSGFMVAQWEPFGPEGISANRICFILDNESHWGICHDQGICLYDHMSQLWTDHPSDLPVIDAYYLNGNQILTIRGCGSNSDGIYAFDPDSGGFTLIDWSDCPNFIAYDEILQKYYIGSRLGLISSNNGVDWIETSVFSNMNIVDMAIYQNHIVVSHMDNLYSTWHSDDHGASWTQSPAGSPMIGDLEFDHDGTLYGIFPDESWSSGLWSSQDYGETWDVEFWSVNMNCLGVDVFNDVYTGWGENPMGQEEGIAHWEPWTGNLTFINEGLSSLIINQICINPTMSAIALFCCTEDGAYISFDYVGMEERPPISAPAYLQISPNPASERAVIKYTVPAGHGKPWLRVFGNDGRELWDVRADSNRGCEVPDVSGLAPGIYFVVLEYDGHRFSQKMMVK